MNKIGSCPTMQAQHRRLPPANNTETRGRQKLADARTAQNLGIPPQRPTRADREREMLDHW